MIKHCSVGCIAQLTTPRSTDKPFLESHETIQAVSSLVGDYIRVLIALDSLPTSYIYLSIFGILERDARHLTFAINLNQGTKNIRDTHVAAGLKFILFHIIIQ